MKEVLMNKEKQIITLSIQEIVNDFYKLAQEEGYLSGKADAGEYLAEDIESYFDNMINLCKKYIPTFEKHISETFWDKELDEQGLELSSLLEQNFKEIFYGLV